MKYLEKLINSSYIVYGLKVRKMKLTAKAIEKIGENRTAAMLALAFNVSEEWIKRLVKRNRNNGQLTTAKALEVIRLETGLQDHEILEEVETKIIS